MKTKLLKLMAFCSFCLAVAMPVKGQIINVQFAGSSLNPSPVYTGAGVIGSSGDYWNTLNTASAIPTTLSYSTGALGSGVQISAFGQIATAGANAGVNSPFYGTSQQNLMAGYNTIYSGYPVITLTGLAASQKYDIYLYSSGAGASTRAIQFGLSYPYSNVPGGVSSVTVTYPGTGAPSTFTLGVNYGVLNAISDASGTLSFYRDVVSGQGDFNGFQVAMVPEPNQTALLIIGCAALLVFIRVRRSAIHA